MRRPARGSDRPPQARADARWIGGFNLANINRRQRLKARQDVDLETGRIDQPQNAAAGRFVVLLGLATHFGGQPLQIVDVPRHETKPIAARFIAKIGDVDIGVGSVSPHVKGLVRPRLSLHAEVGQERLHDSGRTATLSTTRVWPSQ